MTRTPFFWPAVLVLGALLLAAVLLGFWIKPVEVPAPPPAVTAPSASKPRSGDGFGAADLMTSGGSISGRLSGGAAETDLAEDGGEPEQPWEKAINQLLDSDEENEKVAASLAALAPTLPLEGQVEAIQHMVNLLDDEQYALAQNMVMNPGLHPDVREVLFSDVLDRPNNVKLPVLLTLLGSPGHPLRTEAHTNLQAVIGQDLGESPMLWSQPVQAFLEREAAEEAEAEAEAEADEQATLNQ